MKRILTIQDISCAGRCSTSLALPVLSAMGIECVVLPTQILSTHTLFPQPVRLDLSEFSRQTLRHWQQVGMTFDGILIGYLGGQAQLALAQEAVDLFRREGCPLIVDPAMADHGRLYGSIDPGFPLAMARLCRKADLLLPNITEACLLTGTAYSTQPALQALAGKLLDLGVGAVMITGAQTQPDSTGFYYRSGDDEYIHQVPMLSRSSHGTGDLFAAVTAGALLRGESAVDAGIRAAQFICAALEATPPITPYGVHFEKVLHTLKQPSP
jgi:pyridoxine kinase